MKFTTPGSVELAINFRYEEKALPMALHGESIHNLRGMVTTCQITTRDKKVIEKGVAYCGPKDRFLKEVGRKIALKRAIASWDKINRSLAWEAYNNRGSGTKDVPPEAAETLCQIYFEIAEEALGEDEVRKQRDKKISELRSL